MPVSVGLFYIRQPRVSSINAVTTSSPTSYGNFTLLDGFEISYVGSAVKCLLYVTGTRVLTICDDTHNHLDNLNIQTIGLKIQDLVTLINNNSAYSCILITSRPQDDTFLIDVNKYSLIGNPKIIQYNTEKEYIVDVHTKGNLGEASVNIKTENFTYRGETSKWIIDEGFIHDSVNVPVPLNGEIAVGVEGLYLKFYPSISETSVDLENLVTFNDVELIRSSDQPISSAMFPVAPVLLDNTLEININQILVESEKDFIIDSGDKPAIDSLNKGPYTFNSSNNILKVRWNSDPVQTFTFTEETLSAFQVSELINQTSINFKAIVLTDDLNRRSIRLLGNYGTLVHQLRVEDGSANTVFGFSDFASKKGSGVGQIFFLTHVNMEDLTPTEQTDFITASASSVLTDNPFLGVYLNNFKIYENGDLKIKDIDFLVDDAGNINLIERVPAENLVDYVLKNDTELFEPSYIIYANGLPLVEGQDYTLNPQGGWITLSQSAFPGTVYSASYINSVLGRIENEIVLGGKPSLIGSLSAPYNFNNNNNIFKVTVGDTPEQVFNLGVNSSTTLSMVINNINLEAQGFICVICGDKLEISGLNYGVSSTLKIGDGSANSILGFSDNQSSAGYGAEGGERSLEVKNAPMDIVGFTAPESGDTIFIKNKDVTDRYKKDTVISINGDYYQVYDSYLEDKANLINNVAGPYTIIQDNNDIFKFNVNGTEDVLVKLNAGSGVTATQVVAQINKVKPLSCKLLKINGVDRIQLVASSEVTVGEGSANRTLGFDEGASDTDAYDTFIKIVGRFKTTYVAPIMATTVDSISFSIFDLHKLQVPQNSNSIFLLGDHSLKFTKNIMIRVGGFFYYKVLGSSFDIESNLTEITLHAPLDTAVFEDTSLGYTSLPIYEENEVFLKTKKFAFLNEPHVIRKNSVILNQDIDYSISETGDIELLVEGVNFGDAFLIEYTARRYLDSNTEVKATYSYFDFLRNGTNIRFSAQAYNPDNFYVNFIHGSTLLNRVSDDIAQTVSNNSGSGSAGFPSGSISSTENDESGSGNLNFSIGDTENRIDIAKKVFEFYDYRIESFEDERNSLNGLIVGAENGRVTIQQVEDSATLNAPQRLFPSPDNRPIEERTEPLRIPALDGLNQNDLGNATNGVSSQYLTERLNTEKIQAQNEINNLEYLKSINISSSILDFSISGLNGGNIVVYVEIQRSSGVIANKIMTIGMPTVSVDSGPPIVTTSPSNIQVANTINNYLSSSSGFSESVTPCSAPGGVVRITSSSSSKTKCFYILEVNASLGLVPNTQASIRSRHTQYTAGATYDITVPTSQGVHTDIVNHTITRSIENNLHSNQFNALDRQMDEWLGSYAQSFLEAKQEKQKVDIALGESSLFDSMSSDFSSYKFGSGTFNSIDNLVVIESRISDLSTRIDQIDRRLMEATNRLLELTSSLSRENLYNPRFSWVSLLADKSTGYYASKSRDLYEQAKKDRVAATNLEALLSLGSLF